MIRYRYANSVLLFVGINPHPGSFRREVPFSNNKMFWYLLADSGLINISRDKLKDDAKLRRFYRESFHAISRLGFINIIDRPTVKVAELRRGEEEFGVARLNRIIKRYAPLVICFVGKAPYEKYTGKKAEYGWQGTIGNSRMYVMHAPIRGRASVRIRELRVVARSVGLPVFS